MLDWAENDELFFKELKLGHSWQAYPALFLTLHGFKVEMPNLSIRENINEADKYKNSADIIINGKILECKSRNESFTSISDFPYETIIVDTVSGYDAKNPKPLAYIMISKITGSMLCLPSLMSSKWVKKSIKDQTRRILDEFYMANKGLLLTMDKLVKHLQKTNDL